MYQTRAPEHRLVVFGVLPSLPPDNYALLVYKVLIRLTMHSDG